MVTSPHEKGGHCSPPACPSAAATGDGKDKATHTDDETRKRSNEDGARAMESFKDGISRTNRRVNRSHWPHRHTGSGRVNSEGESASSSCVRRPENFDSGRRHRSTEFPRCPMDGARRGRRLTWPWTRTGRLRSCRSYRKTFSKHIDKATIYIPIPTGRLAVGRL